jgi:hypothetical protein
MSADTATRCAMAVPAKRMSRTRDRPTSGLPLKPGRFGIEPARRLRPAGSTLIGSPQIDTLYDVHPGARVARWPPPRICSSRSISRSRRWVQGVTSRNPWIRQPMSRLVQGNALHHLAMHLELDGGLPLRPSAPVRLAVEDDRSRGKSATPKRTGRCYRCPIISSGRARPSCGT